MTSLARGQLELGAVPGVGWRMLVRSTLVGFFFLIGCSEEGERAAGTSTSASASAPKVDRGAYCEQACRRATSCGIENAEKLARSTPKEAALIQQWKQGAGATSAECVTECTSDAEVDADVLAAANRCLEQASCDTFSRCIADVDKRGQ
jgi:hypothetical protein